MEALTQDAPFLAFLGVVAVALIQAYQTIQLKKLDKKNTKQHDDNKAAADERLNAQTDKLSGKLDMIHEDVRENTIGIAVLGQKLDTHTQDQWAHSGT